jgi:hypothetical protein
MNESLITDKIHHQKTRQNLQTTANQNKTRREWQLKRTRSIIFISKKPGVTVKASKQKGNPVNRKRKSRPIIDKRAPQSIDEIFFLSVVDVSLTRNFAEITM